LFLVVLEIAGAEVAGLFLGYLLRGKIYRRRTDISGPLPLPARLIPQAQADGLRSVSPAGCWSTGSRCMKLMSGCTPRRRRRRPRPRTQSG